MPGLDRRILDAIDHASVIERVKLDIRSDFIFAPHTRRLNRPPQITSALPPRLIIGRAGVVLDCSTCGSVGQTYPMTGDDGLY